MSEADAQAVEAFRAQLRRAQADYLLSGDREDGQVQLQFIGAFQQQPVIWDATIVTLAHYNASRAVAADRQFIDIADSGNPLRKITIALQLDRIDTPAILKTIIMVRKYKRLHPGRHEFGY